MTSTEKKGIGIIGAGYRGLNTLAEAIFDTQEETGFVIRALADSNPDRLAEAGEHVKARQKGNAIDDSVSLYEDSRKLIGDPRISIIMITTPQCAHKEAALAALASGKKVYLDKPIAHTREDAEAIIKAEKKYDNPLLMGFTRRYESPWRRAFDLLDSGVIGDLQMMLLRDFIPFHTYFHRWHRERRWSGGALNDKSSHHFDVFNWFARSRPVMISSAGGRSVFKERAGAPERCLDCDDKECPYRVGPTRGKLLSPEEMVIDGDAWTKADNAYQRVDTCVFAPGADIFDHMSSQVVYENGVIATINTAFFGPKADDQETFELLGSRGRLTVIRHKGIIEMVTDYGSRIESLDARDEDFTSSHFGADRKLIRELSRFAAGEKPTVSATEGFLSMELIDGMYRNIDKGGGSTWL